MSHEEGISMAPGRSAHFPFCKGEIETAGQVKPEWIKHFQTLKESFFRPVAPEQQ